MLFASHRCNPGGIHNSPARTLVRQSVHVEPVVEPDPELDDPHDEDEEREEDERELDHRLTALGVLAMAPRRSPITKSHNLVLLSERWGKSMSLCLPPPVDSYEA